jgi:lipopolysaccharide transport system ATP-binding protein
METVIKAEHISKKYILRHERAEKYKTLAGTISNLAKSKAFASKEEFLALNDISFEINQGERVGIIGRNGAGKSTLLKVLSRIVTPSAGRVEITGRVSSLLEVGTGFHPELSGRENIFLNGSILGMSKKEIQNKFDEIVDFAEVEKFLDTPVKRYSSGMYVRLAFAVAAHLEPEILIVDEVLAVGDAAFQRKCLGKMNDVAGQGRTILFVSHNMEAVQKLCNKGILLQNGKLIESGAINSVVEKYLEVHASHNSSYEITSPKDSNEIPGYAYKLQIEDENAKPVSEIPVGKSFQVRVFFKINKPTPGFVIALGVSTMLDMPLQTTWSIPQDMQSGEYEVVFKNSEIIYTEGQYKLVVGLSSDKRVIQYVEGAGFITISDVSTLTGDERIINTKSGLLINQMNTVITKK